MADATNDPLKETPSADAVSPAPAPNTEAGVTGSKLGTFQGVFRPTVMTILGLMMYVREGWVVGEAGLLGAVLIILLTFFITGTAALSLSSIATNIHVGPGGVFSIIAQSLGLETGGSIGVPLFLGQSLSAALYIYGFTEAWQYIFPEHSAYLVAYIVFVVAFGVTLLSTRLAFRVQGLVLVVILASLASIALGLTALGGAETLQRPRLWGPFTGTSFLVLFAIFFPAGTGVKVGASMSGALADPRKSIPRGTLAAVATALVVYLSMAIWYSLVATPEALRENPLIVVEKAAVGELVLAGILASTFTATLSTLIAAPRVLQALAEQRIVPKSGVLGQLHKGEPRNAILANGGLVAAALLLGGLDTVAMLITMFFLLIYLTINVVVVIEQNLGLIAFRPTFSIPRWVPVAGLLGCTVVLFVINPVFALVALAVVGGIYIYLASRRLETPWQTVRSSIFVSMADWASKRIARTPEEANERAWKPDLLVFVTSRSQLDGIFRLLRLLVEPKGSLKIIGVRLQREEESEAPRLPGTDGLDTLGTVATSFHARQLFATATLIRARSLGQGIETSAAVMRGSAFRPNVLFGLARHYDQETLQRCVDVAARDEMGVALYFEHPEAGLGQEQRINIWVSDQSPDWELGLRLPNLDLTVLLGYQVNRNWQGRMRLLTVCRDPEEESNARAYLQRLKTDARLPEGTELWVSHGAFEEALGEAPEADLSILGLAREVDDAFLGRVSRRTRSSCLFVRDSGRESALA